MRAPSRHALSMQPTQVLVDRIRFLRSVLVVVLPPTRLRMGAMRRDRARRRGISSQLSSRDSSLRGLRPTPTHEHVIELEPLRAVDRHRAPPRRAARDPRHRASTSASTNPARGRVVDLRSSLVERREETARVREVRGGNRRNHRRAPARRARPGGRAARARGPSSRQQDTESRATGGDAVG